MIKHVTRAVITQRLNIGLFRRFTGASVLSSLRKHNINMELRPPSQKTPEWLYKILEENSTERFKMEYSSSLSNHIAHAIISLYRSGCGEDRIQEYAKWYSNRLVSNKTTTTSNNQPDPKSLLGKNDLECFNVLVDHYKKILSEVGDIESLVRQEFPKLSAALSTSALHGLIELGYGLSVRSSRNVCQGLAYLHYSYTPLGLVDVYEGPELETLGKGAKDIITVLEEVRNDNKLRESVFEISKDPARNRSRTRIQNRMGALLDYHTDEVLNYVHSIKFPDFWNVESLDDKQLTQICNWVTDCAITAYVASERKNDFFLIHGVTGAWSLSQIIPILNDKQHAIRALRVFLCTMIGDYIAVKCPALNSTDEPVKTIAETFAEVIAKDEDEHIYKLIQVCAERDLVNPESRRLYTTACNIAIKYPLSYPTKDDSY